MSIDSSFLPHLAAGYIICHFLQSLGKFSPRWPLSLVAAAAVAWEVCQWVALGGAPWDQMDAWKDVIYTIFGAALAARGRPGACCRGGT